LPLDRRAVLGSAVDPTYVRMTSLIPTGRRDEARSSRPSTVALPEPALFRIEQTSLLRHGHVRAPCISDQGLGSHVTFGEAAAALARVTARRRSCPSPCPILCSQPRADFGSRAIVVPAATSWTRDRKLSGPRPAACAIARHVELRPNALKIRRPVESSRAGPGPEPSRVQNSHRASRHSTPAARAPLSALRQALQKRLQVSASRPCAIFSVAQPGANQGLVAIELGPVVCAGPRRAAACWLSSPSGALAAANSVSRITAPQRRVGPRPLRARRCLPRLRVVPCGAGTDRGGVPSPASPADGRGSPSPPP